MILALLLAWSGAIAAEEVDCEAELSRLRTTAPVTLDVPSLRRGFRNFWQAVENEREIDASLVRVQTSLVEHQPAATSRELLKTAYQQISARLRYFEALKNGPLAQDYPRLIEVQRVLLVRADHLKQMIDEEEHPPQSPAPRGEPEPKPEAVAGQGSTAEGPPAAGEESAPSQEGSAGEKPSPGEASSTTAAVEDGTPNPESPATPSLAQAQGEAHVSVEAAESTAGDEPSGGESESEKRGKQKQDETRPPLPYDGKLSTENFRERWSGGREEGGGYGNRRDGKHGFGESLFDSIYKWFGKRDYRIAQESDPEADEIKHARKRRNQQTYEFERERLEGLLKEYWKPQRSRRGLDDWDAGLFDSTETERMVRAYVQSQWTRTLKRYDSYPALLAGLMGFREFCKRVQSEYRGFAFLAEYEMKSAKLYDEVNNLRAKFTNVMEVSTSVFSLGLDSEQAMANLGVEQKTLAELALATKLSFDERAAFDALNRFFSQLNQTQPDESEVAHAFMRTMNGPLSRDDLRSQFPGDSPDGVDAKKLVASMRAGGLDPYLYITRLSSYLEFFRFQSMIPRFIELPDGQRLPIDDQEFELVPPEDLNNFPMFFQNGPPQLTAERFFSGDILEMVYRELQPSVGTVKEKDRIVTILISDISGSMQFFRSTVQGALNASFVDRNQREVNSGQAEHIFYHLPFGLRPSPHTRYEGRAQFQQFYSSQIRAPHGSESDTRFAPALIKALELAATESKARGGVKRINFLMTTDGEDSAFRFELLKAAREAIPPDIELALSVVAIDHGNAIMDQAQKDGTALKYFNRFQYHFMSPSEIQTLFSREAILAHVSEVAKTLQFSGGQSTSALVALSQALARLELGTLLDFDSRPAEIEKQLLGFAPKIEKSDMDRVFELLFSVEIPEVRSKSERKLEKLKSLSDLIRHIATEKKQAEDLVLGGIGRTMRERILKWLEN